MHIPNYHISIGNVTDVGRVREHNEDYLAHFDTPLGYCIIVCDGMGGHAAGEVASQNATAAMQQFLQDKKNGQSSIQVMLRSAIEFANYRLREMVKQTPALRGMGTTCVIAVIKNGMLYTAHAGDSRIYLVRKDVIKQVTKDHSSVQKLIDMGVMTEAEAEVSDKKNEISKAIGIFDKADPSVNEIPIPLYNGDKILLCSDGLTGHVKNGQLHSLIMAADDVQVAAMNLVHAANNLGGSDNITVQLVHYTGKTMVKTKLSPKKIGVAVVVIFLMAIVGYLLISNFEKLAIAIGFQKKDTEKAKIDSTLLFTAIEKEALGKMYRFIKKEKIIIEAFKKDQPKQEINDFVKRVQELEHRININSFDVVKGIDTSIKDFDVERYKADSFRNALSLLSADYGTEIIIADSVQPGNKEFDKLRDSYTGQLRERKKIIEEIREEPPAGKKDKSKAKPSVITTDQKKSNKESSKKTVDKPGKAAVIPPPQKTNENTPKKEITDSTKIKKPVNPNQ